MLRLLVGDFFAARFVFDSAGDRFRGQQLVKQILTCRQARAYRGQTLTGKVHACHAGQLLGDGLIRTVLIGHAAQ
ncbi:hypothetical protein D3C76_1645640 [compost metagenome]